MKFREAGSNPFVIFILGLTRVVKLPEQLPKESTDLFRGLSTQNCEKVMNSGLDEPPVPFRIGKMPVIEMIDVDELFVHDPTN